MDRDRLMGDVSAVISAFGVAVAAVLTAVGLLARQQKLVAREIRQELDEMRSVSSMEAEMVYLLQVTMAAAGVPIPARVLELQQQVQKIRGRERQTTLPDEVAS